MTNPAATPATPSSASTGTGSAARPVAVASTTRTVAQPSASGGETSERFDPRTPADRFTRAKGELEAQDAVMRKRLTTDQYAAWRTAEDQRLADVAALEASESAQTK